MKKELEHFFNAVKSKKTPLSSGRYALKILKLLEKIKNKIN